MHLLRRLEHSFRKVAKADPWQHQPCPGCWPDSAWPAFASREHGVEAVSSANERPDAMRRAHLGDHEPARRNAACPKMGPTPTMTLLAPIRSRRLPGAERL